MKDLNEHLRVEDIAFFVANTPQSFKLIDAGKFKQFLNKINHLSAENHFDMQMKKIKGGACWCGCSCYWANKYMGGSRSSDNHTANAHFGYTSTEGGIDSPCPMA
ncbi:MAG: hypothetical protein Q8908_05200 [Bacteroidota bacterium]|nr:hypothetical protein [Bacteroidota bacterium]